MAGRDGVEVRVKKSGKTVERLELTTGTKSTRLAVGEYEIELIGDADGLPPALLARADEKLALSRLTLPHRIARLVLLEQIYRALSIVRGEPYHRG